MFDKSLTRQVAEKGWENVPEEAREGVGRPAPPLPEYVDFLRECIGCTKRNRPPMPASRAPSPMPASRAFSTAS